MLDTIVFIIAFVFFIILTICGAVVLIRKWDCNKIKEEYNKLQEKYDTTWRELASTNANIEKKVEEGLTKASEELRSYENIIKDRDAELASNADEIYDYKEKLKDRDAEILEKAAALNSLMMRFMALRRIIGRVKFKSHDVDEIRKIVDDADPFERCSMADLDILKEKVKEGTITADDINRVVEHPTMKMEG